jgi:hypothetical protein
VGHCLGQHALGTVDLAKVVVVLRLLRVYRQCLVDVSGGNFMLARLVCNDPQEVESIGMLGLHLEDLPVEGLGFPLSPSLVVLNCLIEGFRESLHGTVTTMYPVNCFGTSGAT